MREGVSEGGGEGDRNDSVGRHSPVQTCIHKHHVHVYT